MKRHLNFIPKDMKAAWEVRHELVPLALFIAFVFYAGAGPIRLSVLSQMSEKEIAQLEATSVELDEKVKAMNEQSKAVAQTSENLSAIQQVLARKNYWSEVFKEMSILVPEDVWLTNFSNLKSGGKTAAAAQAPVSGSPESLVVKGYATSQLAVGRFLKTLEESAFFTGARMVSTEKEKDVKPARYSFEFFIPVKMSGGAKR
jgi:Tfp pilus assembly protein PilN